MSETLDGITNTSEGALNGGLKTVLNPEDTSNNNDESGLYHLHKKTKVMHAPVSSLNASSNNTNSVDSTLANSSIYSRDSKSAKILQSSRAGICPEKHSARHQNNSVPKEYSAKMLYGFSDYGTSDDESPNPSASVTYHARYRSWGPNLMTLHKFTGKMRGKTPIYVPVYKRNNDGKLLKLVNSWSGRWEYIELKTLTEEEGEEEEEEEGEGEEGLKIFKARVVLESPETKKAVGCRTLADFGLPETKRQGGWGWL
ncbi:MAG: hypothetical protein ALECFALPRED_000582 [Alectoria fallacina]|uniref:Uncharacterized protein n=1 Tax=Alectoria fallacina TaxID=1903189 RepID=A0A8H3FCA8_9LECA|nr:MAG: hypothetical protein ALECFALPRED_000582 [Alectoria fallacina]